MATRTPTDQKSLARLFANRGIPTDAPAFYNHPAFLKAERDDPAFLEVYGSWVRCRPRTQDYEAHVRKVVPLIAEVVGKEIARDGQLGVCVDASMMLTKMLEEEGVWCYGAKGALTIFAPSLPDPTHFWMLDETPVAGHVWVVAPPFEIVDVTLKTQPYERGEAALVPPSVVTEHAELIVPTAEEYVAANILRRERMRMAILPSDVHLQISPDLARAVKAFPSWQVEVGTTTLRYAAGGVTVSDGPSLHAITSRRWNGLLAGELFDEVVRPALRAAG